MFSTHYLEKCLPKGSYILYADWSWEHYIFRFWVHQVKGQRHNRHFRKNMFALIFLWTITHRDFILHMLNGIDGELTPIDIDLVISRKKDNFGKNGSPYYIQNCLL